MNSYGGADMKIGQKIRDAREDMDLLQTDMAELIPMNQSNYSKIERDIQEPSLDQLRRICQILRLDPIYLLEIDDYDVISYDDLSLLKDIKILIEKIKTAVLKKYGIELQEEIRYL